MKTDYTKIDVENLLPHSGDMVLIDKMLEYGDDYGVSGVKVRTDSKFYDQDINGIHSEIGLEWMAQTIAAIAGITALQNNKPVQVGFLLGSRKYEPTTSVFKLDEEFVIQVQQLYREENGLGAFDCSIRQGNKLIAESKLNVYAPDNVEKFLKGEGV